MKTVIKKSRIFKFKIKNYLENLSLTFKISFQIQKVSDESVLEKIENVLGRMDDDRDGSLKVEDVLKVIFETFL